MNTHHDFRPQVEPGWTVHEVWLNDDGTVNTGTYPVAGWLLAADEQGLRVQPAVWHLGELTPLSDFEGGTSTAALVGPSQSAPDLAGELASRAAVAAAQDEAYREADDEVLISATSGRTYPWRRHNRSIVDTAAEHGIDLAGERADGNDR